jgi:radical SAM superfamily enzyme YgiQ (UPF0313 family)
MLGPSTETDEDVLGIADLAQKVLLTWKNHAANKSHGVRITVSTSCFVPKPHTPFPVGTAGRAATSTCAA